ncbi:MAG: hypothetical protein M3Y77_08130 [Actinomycetota bacterium]|nr:hypothetical protein [Actinomycetota bacterium]
MEGAPKLAESQTLPYLESGPPVFAPLLASLVGGMGLVAAVLRALIWNSDPDGNL